MKIAAPIILVLFGLASLPASCRRPVQTEPGGKDMAAAQQQELSATSDMRLAPLPPKDDEKAWTCPFCGMKLRAGESAATFEHDGKTYHFCTKDHMEAFKKDPEMYLDIDSAEDD